MNSYGNVVIFFNVEKVLLIPFIKLLIQNNNEIIKINKNINSIIILEFYKTLPILNIKLFTNKVKKYAS